MSNSSHTKFAGSKATLQTVTEPQRIALSAHRWASLHALCSGNEVQAYHTHPRVTVGF